MPQDKPAPAVSHRKSQRKLGVSIGLFLGVLTAYGGVVAAMLAAPFWWSIALVPICGLLVVMLFVIGHDACHQSFTPSRALNHLIGRIAFLPSIHCYSLWDCEHNQRHHRFNNIKHLDYAWIPMSPAEYARAPLWQRLRYRFYRTPIGVLAYYLFELWAQRNLVPRRSLIGRATPVMIADSLGLAVMLLVYGSGLVLIGREFGKSPVEVLTLTLLLPFLIFSGLMSAAIFLHHTHFSVPWYTSIDEWKARQGATRGTVHVEFPTLFRWLILNIMVHDAHHRAPGVPLYSLKKIQPRITTPEIVTWRFTFPQYFEICSRCKLFDYDASRWFDFAGNATGDPIRP